LTCSGSGRFFDEELAAAALGERPLAQTGADHLEIFEDGVSVDDLPGLHSAASSLRGD
jgi:hypothetical protein